MAKASWKPTLKSGVPYDECVSGLQKMIRRGMEREALIFAQELFESGFHGAVARRLMIIAAEDVGLADSAVVAQVYSLCSGYLIAKKESPSKKVEPLALVMSILLLVRSRKNRECDNAQIVIMQRLSAGQDCAARIINEHYDLVVDRHTERGKARLRSRAEEISQPYESVAMREFLTVGASLVGHAEVRGDPWDREMRELYDLDSDS